MEKNRQIHEIVMGLTTGKPDVWLVYGSLEDFIAANLATNRFIRRSLKDNAFAIYSGVYRLGFQQILDEDTIYAYIERYEKLLSTLSSRHSGKYGDKPYAEFRTRRI